MAASGGSAMSNVASWGRAHPRLSAIVIAVLSFLIGLTAGGSGLAELEADLQAARADLRAVTADADAEESDLAADLDALEDENADLERQIERLDARRELPDLTGTTRADALDLEHRYGWSAAIEYRYSTARPGTILAQRPAPGTMMRYGAPFTLVVAQALPKVSDAVGMWREAALRSLGRWDVVVVEQVSAKSPGRVIAMSPPAGSPLLPGETITLTVAKKAPPPPPVVAEPAEETGCTAGYSPCLPPASDYDCAGGTGDGPEYTGYVTVTGADPYDLDSDGDGAGCES